MADLGPILYLLLALLLWLFRREARGQSFDELLRRSQDEHHRVHRLLARHPRGGAWAEHKAWMADTKSR